jgi:hypothetical protein
MIFYRLVVERKWDGWGFFTRVHQFCSFQFGEKIREKWLKVSVILNPIKHCFMYKFLIVLHLTLDVF